MCIRDNKGEERQMYDYHSHTFFSDDSSTPLKNMVEASIRLGIKELAITDHYDPDYPDQCFPFELEITLYYKAIVEAEKEYLTKLKVIKWIEIGIQHGETNK